MRVPTYLQGVVTRGIYKVNKDTRTCSLTREDGTQDSFHLEPGFYTDCPSAYLEITEAEYTKPLLEYTL